MNSRKIAGRKKRKARGERTRRLSATSATESASDQAMELFQGVIARLSTPNADLPSALRTALHAAHLLGWSDAADWLLKEIKGHDGHSVVPAHRTVQAYVQWRPYAMHDIIEQVVKETREVEDREPVTWVLLAGIDQLVKYGEKGVIVREEAAEERWFDISKKMTRGRKVTVAEAPQVKHCLEGLQNELFDWTSRSYAALKTGDVASDIWQANRSAVDQFLATIGLTGHLGAIQDGLISKEPQQWREAMWSSRDLLHDLAAYLWRDARKTYRHLSDEDGKPIEVTDNKYINRLMAYMYQKGVTGTSGAYLRSEWVRLRSLNAFASSAHDLGAVSFEDAQLVFFSVYSLLSELVKRTDVKPVEKYQ